MDAQIMTRICPRCRVPVSEDHSPDEKACSDNCLARMQAEVTMLKAEVERLTAEATKVLAERKQAADAWTMDLQELADQVQKREHAEARVARLEAALRQYNEVAGKCVSAYERRDSSMTETVADLLAAWADAKAALAAEGP